jgi:hypothetical protein
MECNESRVLRLLGDETNMRVALFLASVKLCLYYKYQGIHSDLQSYELSSHSSIFIPESALNPYLNTNALEIIYAFGLNKEKKRRSEPYSHHKHVKCMLC